MESKHIYAVQSLALGFLEAVTEAGPLGAPAGVMYAAVMSQISLSQFQQIMGQMEGRGFVKQEFDCYTITNDGKKFMAKLKASVEAVAKEMRSENSKDAIPA